MSDSVSCLQDCLDRLKSGDPNANQDLLRYAYGRLRKITRRQVRSSGQVEETDDILHAGLIRLFRALESVQPESVAEFLGLAARQIRWALLDAIKHRPGPSPEGSGPPDHQPGPATAAEESDLVRRLSEAIDQLPEELRFVVDCTIYAELSQAEIAGVLGVSERTVKRRWRQARLALYDQLGPALDRPLFAAGSDEENAHEA
jgi:RNA polymerase sigma-70 factor (ECF subfamily)